jgi:AraC family transcriptional regulator, transcriptional activator of pobA
MLKPVARMDEAGLFRYFPAMTPASSPIPAWQLYGEDSPFPDILHIERIVDRAEGLHWRIAPHRHLHLHQVFLILSGEVKLTMDGRQVEGSPPLILNIPRETVHGFDFAAATDGYVLTLPAADFPELFAPSSEPVTALGKAFAAPATAVLEAQFSTIAALHAEAGALRRLRLRAAALTLCCAVADLVPSSLPAAVGVASDPRIAAFEALVRSHLDQHWQLDDYARALAVSERHLRRMCVTATGLSARALVETIRLREASRLLAYTRMRVQEVGFALGFDDPAYFARVFRRGMGLSPGDYRARLDR